MVKNKEKDAEFYSKNIYEVINSLESSKEGLKSEEVNKRQILYGKNVLEKKRFKGLIIFLRQFQSPLVWILIATVFVSLLLKEFVNSLIIFIVLFLSSLISFYDEYKSEKIIESLNNKIAHKTIVMRNSKKEEVYFKDLVVGDIVYLNIGSVIPADLRLIETKNLEINEAILTGESENVRKTSLEIKTPIKRLSDYSNYAFAGSIVQYGDGVGIVIRTGKDTELGKISKDVNNERPETEFQKGLSGFGKLLFNVIMFFTIFIFLFNALLKHDIINSLLFSLAIAVGLTPELLPAIISVSLSKGARSMSKKDVVVKRLISIEDLGNMDVLCTDKTGTLTEGNLEFEKSITFDNKPSKEVLFYGLLCNSTIAHGDKFIGNPIDVAIWKEAYKKFHEDLKYYERIDEVPFDYDRKRMSVIVNKGKDRLMITKGSPRLILDKCKSVFVNNKISSISYHSKSITESFNKLSQEGCRVIAVAYKDVKEKESYDIKDEDNLVFFGFLVFSDRPKRNIKKSLLRLEELNVKLKILTGDNEIVTKKIATEVGIPLDRIVLAEEIDKLNDDELKKLVEVSNAFCRLNPMQKLRIIRALKSNGHDVGYMGDGVNDVPSLHEADVGISVNDAVDVAKESSDIILMKKSIGSLAEGVVEGRKIFNNTVKYIVMGTSSNFGNMFSAAVSSLFLPFLPMLPMQILLVNLLYDSSQLTISSDNTDEEALKKPKRLRIDFIKKNMLFLGPISSFYDFLTYGVMIFVFKASEALFRTGWFIESMITEIFVVFVIRTRRVPFYKSKPGKLLVISSIIVGTVVLIIPFSPVAGILGFERPPLLYFIILTGIIISYVIVVDFFKNLLLKKYDI